MSQSSGDPLVDEVRRLVDNDYPWSPEARLLLEMAAAAQQGKPVDLSRLETKINTMDNATTEPDPES